MKQEVSNISEWGIMSKVFSTRKIKFPFNTRLLKSTENGKFNELNHVHINEKFSQKNFQSNLM
jgi:hypothetical protein